MYYMYSYTAIQLKIRFESTLTHVAAIEDQTPTVAVPKLHVTNGAVGAVLDT